MMCVAMDLSLRRQNGNSPRLGRCSILFLLVLLMAGPGELRAADADSHTPESNQAARDFSVSEIKIGMSLDEVKALGLHLTPYPRLTKPELKVVSYRVEGDQRPEFLVLLFFDGKLFEMDMGYLSKTIQEIGGWQAIYHRLVTKLGPSIEDEKTVITAREANWRFTKAEREFTFSWGEGSVFMTVSDKVAQREILDLAVDKPKAGSGSAPAANSNTSTSDVSRTVLDFSLSGIKIGMTPEEVKTLGAKLESNFQADDPEVKLACYTAKDFQGLDLLVLRFVDGKLCTMSVAYSSETLTKLGGWQTVYQRLMAKLGPPRETPDTIEANKSAIWLFPDQNRTFTMGPTESGLLVTICDLNATSELSKKREAKVNIGF